MSVGVLRTVALALAFVAGAAFAQANDAKGPPSGFVAPAEPKAGENNAERSKTQPGNNAPFWTGVRQSGDQPGYSSLPGREQGVLIQSFTQYPGSKFTTAGEAWRQVRNQWIIPYGGALLLIVALGVVLMWFAKGPLGHATNDGPKRIERFTYFERAAHWSTAITFCILAVSGIVMAFGKYFLLPVMGGTLFGLLTYALKTAHNFVGPVFAVALMIVFVAFLKDNLPRAADLKWIARAGGAFGGGEVPSHRFNAAEKVVFWGGVFVLGGIVSASGFVLDMIVPGLVYDRANMQVANMVHAVASVLMMAMFIGHIYIGSIGMRGAYRGMRDGYVSDEWAHEHHALWADDIAAGKIPAQRSTPPAATASPMAPT